MKVEFEITQDPAKYLEDLWELMTYNDKYWVLQMQSSIVRSYNSGDATMIELLQSAVYAQRSKTELLLRHFNQIAQALGLSGEISDPFADAENIQMFLDDMKGRK